MAVALVLAIFAVPMNAAEAAKPGAKCSSIGAEAVYQKKKLRCLVSGKFLRWVDPKKKTAETPKKIIAPTPEQTIAVKWQSLDMNAINVFNKWGMNPIPQKHNVNFDWVLSAKADNGAVAEVKRRYELAAKFWAPYSNVSNALKVLIANHNEADWICAKKLEWLRINQNDCIEIESNGRNDIPTAGQFQSQDRNVDMYQIKNLDEMKTRFFLGRIEHEFTHNIFYEQSRDYQMKTPCWLIEGGAEYFGILIANNGDLNGYIQVRNATISANPNPNEIQNWTVENWVDYLNEADRSQLGYRDGDSCGPVRRIIYHHATLANEYLNLKLGIPGYLKLIKDASSSSWENALLETFGKDKQAFYKEMAEYMRNQYQLVVNNFWSYSPITKIPFGR